MLPWQAAFCEEGIMADYSRIYHTLRLTLIRSPMARADHLRKHNVFGGIGKRVMITPRKVPLYPKLIKLHDNVWIASNVTFVTHDVSHFMLRGISRDYDVTEKVGPIEIGSNVFIGTGVTIMYDVKIGNNVIVAAGSVITRDIPDNSVVAGVPARVIGSFEDFLAKRRSGTKYKVNNADGTIPPEELEHIWADFYHKREKELVE